jgi:hypothetical protein
MYNDGDSVGAVQIREDLVRGEREREEGRGVLHVLGADRGDAGGWQQVPHAAAAAAAVVRRGLRRTRILFIQNHIVNKKGISNIRIPKKLNPHD